MKCIHCGKTVANDSRFCKYCGTRLRRTCAACGAALDDDARFCADCGAEALAELDFSKVLADLTASDAASAAGRQNNAGFYFSRRISRQTRSASENAFDICGSKLAFMDGQALNVLTQGQTLTRRYADVSHDFGVKALALVEDGLLAAGFDWSRGGEPSVMLWRYDESLNMRAAAEVLLMGGAERRVCRMRLTGRHLFIFLWDNREEGEREIIKYDVATGRMLQKELGGKRIDLWYVDGEKIYFRGERDDGDAFFGVLDTAPEVWTIRRIWTIGNGPDQVPDGPVYCDFRKNLAWTYATAEEQAALGCGGASLVARALAPGHAPVPGCPVWQSAEEGAANLFFDYFDGSSCFKANNVLSMDAYGPNREKFRWKNTLHGDTENIIVWGDKLFADFTSHGYRIYPVTLEGPKDVVEGGAAVRDM